MPSSTGLIPDTTAGRQGPDGGLRAAVGPSLPGSVPGAVALLGDLFVVFGFVAVGISSHGGSPLATLPYLLERVAPFALAWLVVATLSGVYHRQTLAGVRETVALVTLTWPVAALVGSGLRATSLFPGDAPLPFVLVTVLLGGLLLLAWRVAVVVFTRRLAG